jgi:hypothetical protein
LLEEARNRLEESRAEADRQVAAAVEQTAWAGRTVEALLAAAELEAERIRADSHRELARQLAGRRRHLEMVLSRSADKVRERYGEADRRAVDIEEQGQKALADAQAEAERIRQRAGEDADATRHDAFRHLEETETHARRRLEDDDAGARTLREQVAAEVARAQREAQQIVSAARDEASALVEEARRDRERAAAESAALLDGARAEVAELEQQRRAIVDELGGLSGVIQALAVPEPAGEASGATSARPRADSGVRYMHDPGVQQPHQDHE